jgi:hypothetical protein
MLAKFHPMAFVLYSPETEKVKIMVKFLFRQVIKNTLGAIKRRNEREKNK